MSQIPAEVEAAVLKPSEPVPHSSISVVGPDFDQDISLDVLLRSYERIGFQANSLGKAIDIVNRMVRRRLDFRAQLTLNDPLAKVAVVRRTHLHRRTG